MKTYWVMRVYFRDGSARWQGTLSGRVEELTAKKILLQNFTDYYGKEERRKRGGAEYKLFLGQERRSDYSRTNKWELVRRALSRVR